MFNRCKFYFYISIKILIPNINMCGIVAYIGKHEAWPIVLKGLKRLEYRGYDSAGVALIDQKGLSIYKKKGKVAELENHLAEGGVLHAKVGIGHTRWATHGEPNDVNAHPHYSSSERFAMIHNGIIENYDVIKRELISEGYAFRSETDAEVLVHLVDHIAKKEGVKPGMQIVGFRGDYYDLQ